MGQLFHDASPDFVPVISVDAQDQMGQPEASSQNAPTLTQGASAWGRDLGGVGRLAPVLLQKQAAGNAATARTQETATWGQGEDCKRSGPSPPRHAHGPLLAGTERPGTRRIALASPGVDAWVGQEGPEASGFPQGKGH